MNYTCENRNSTGTVYLNVVEPEKDITLLNVEIHFEKPCAPKPVIIRWQEACVDICAALRSNSSFERTLGPNWNKKRNPSRLASCAPIYSWISNSSENRLTVAISDAETPTEISGGKQSWIRIDRMKAWKATELTRELTAADPMAAVARNTGRYWRMYKQSLLVKLVDSVLGLSGLANHTLTVKTGGVTANQLIDVQQSALGDFSGKFGLLVVHSKILAEYKKMGLLNYNKYVITNVLQKEVSLPTINGLVVVENDRGTDDGTNYNSFLLGQGSVLTADPKVITPDYTEYDAAKAGGTDILYNNRSFILHPNGVSFDGDKINKPTPTDDEFTNKANWALKFDHKNVRMGKITIPKANFVEE